MAVTPVPPLQALGIALMVGVVMAALFLLLSGFLVALAIVVPILLFGAVVWGIWSGKLRIVRRDG